MKRFKDLAEELFTEGGEMYPADDMTMKEVKIACYAAQNILDRLENGAMIQRWQISAIVKAAEELSSVYTSMSADEEGEDGYDDEWEDEYDEEPMYVGFEYPSMYEAVDKDHPIVKEYDALKKHDIDTLRGMVKKHSRVIDVSGLKTKDHAITHILRAKHGNKKVDQAFGLKEEAELDENIAGRFKNAFEWESAAKARGLVVKSMTHPSGEMTKYQIAKDKQGNNRGHFDHGTKSGHLKEETDLEEGYNDPIHRKYISDTVHDYVEKGDPKHDKIVDHLHKAKNFGSKTVDSLSNHAGISLGAANAITKEVASNLKANFGSPQKTQTQAQRIGAYLKQKHIGPRSK